MSGGHFQYQQYQIEDIAVEIDEIIRGNDDKSLDEWGQRRGNNYPPEVIEKFREASHTLRQAAEMAQRVDWLVSGDDGEECFMLRWQKEVRPYWPNSTRNSLPNTTTQAAPFAKVFAPSEKGWSMVIGESVTYFNSMQEAIAAAEAHNKRRTKQLSTAAADSQNRPLRVGAVQIGVCGGDDPKTLPRLIPPCPRCGYCGFIEDAEPITKQERTMKKKLKSDSPLGAATCSPSSLTPETDAAWSCFIGYTELLQDVKDLSCKLERERDEARKLAEKWRRESNWIGNEKNYKLPWE